MRLGCLLWALSVPCSIASTITGGEITMPLQGGPGQLILSSTAGYTVDTTASGAAFLSGPFCMTPLACENGPFFPIGTAVSLIATSQPVNPLEFPPCAFSSTTGSGTINGVFYPSLLFYTPGMPPPSCTMFNMGASFTVAGSGLYQVPFAAEGVTLAGLPPMDSETFQPLIDDAWSGSGVVSFSLEPAGNGTFEFAGGSSWVFSPEPGSVLLVAGGLLLAITLGAIIQKFREQDHASTWQWKTSQLL